jgi:hypothetical protein
LTLDQAVTTEFLDAVTAFFNAAQMNGKNSALGTRAKIL